MYFLKILNFLHHRAMERGTDCRVVSTGREEMSVMPAVTAVLLHHCAMNTETFCSVVSTG